MFKIGDKVKRMRFSTYKGLKKGEIYTISYVYEDGDIELEETKDYIWNSRYFKLARERNEI